MPKDSSEHGYDFWSFSQGANIQVKDMNDLADGHTVGFGLTNIINMKHQDY